MKRIAFAIAALAASSAVFAQQQITLRGITPWTADYDLSKGFFTFQQLVNERLKGKVSVSYVGGPEVAAPNQQFQALKKMSQELAAKGEIVTRDIQSSLELGLGGVGPDGQPYKVDLGWFFEQWLHTTAQLDYGIREARATRTASGEWETRVVVTRSGDAWMPVTLQVGDPVTVLGKLHSPVFGMRHLRARSVVHSME